MKGDIKPKFEKPLSHLKLPIYAHIWTHQIFSRHTGETKSGKCAASNTTGHYFGIERLEPENDTNRDKCRMNL